MISYHVVIHDLEMPNMEGVPPHRQSLKRRSTRPNAYMKSRICPICLRFYMALLPCSSEPNRVRAGPDNLMRAFNDFDR